MHISLIPRSSSLSKTWRWHKVWKRLEEAYEGTSTIKDAKLYLFKDKHAKFKMLEGENVLEMFHCLNNIANELRAHGHKV